jgi:hypothetical protein
MAMGETWALVPWIDVAAVVVVEEIGVGVGGVVRGGHVRPAGRLAGAPRRRPLNRVSRMMAWTLPESGSGRPLRSAPGGTDQYAPPS